MANKYPPTTRRLFLPSSDAKYVPRAAGSPLSDAMRKCFPSGRNLGLTNTLLGSFARTGSGLAPAPVTLYNAPLLAPGTRRRVPARFQLPPLSLRHQPPPTAPGPPSASMEGVEAGT